MFKSFFAIIPLLAMVLLMSVMISSPQGKKIMNSFASEGVLSTTSTSTPSGASTSSKRPIGYQDNPNATTCVLYGWTCDPDRSSKALNVNIYDNGKWVTQVVANIPAETGVSSACGGYSAHRWVDDIGHAYANPYTNPYRDGKPHVFTAVALGVNSAGVQDGSNFTLKGSPKTVICGTSPSPTPQPVVDHKPIGYQDNPDTNNCRLAGWTCDSDKYSQILNVHIYDGSKFLGGVIFNGQPSETAVSSICGNTPNHRWLFNLPDSYFDGKQHSLTAYALGIDSTGKENGVNTALSGSPKNIICNGLPPPPP